MVAAEYHPVRKMINHVPAHHCGKGLDQGLRLLLYQKAYDQKH